MLELQSNDLHECLLKTVAIEYDGFDGSFTEPPQTTLKFILANKAHNTMHESAQYAPQVGNT